MSKADPWRDSLAWQANKDWFQPRLNLFLEILDKVEQLERGDENPNDALDFRHADGNAPLGVSRRRM